MENRLNLQLCLRELMRQVDVILLSALRASLVNNIDVHIDIHLRKYDLNVRCQLSVTLNHFLHFIEYAKSQFL